MKNICKFCSNWKNEQSELEYSKFYGVCTCYKWKFDTKIEGDVMVLDRNNLSDTHMNVHRFENQNKNVPIGAKNKSQYCFVTNEFFGCVNFKIKKQD